VSAEAIRTSLSNGSKKSTGILRDCGSVNIREIRNSLSFLEEANGLHDYLIMCVIRIIVILIATIIT